MKKLIDLIYERASVQNIRIEKGPDHRRDRDYTGSGRRFVTFPNGKMYAYGDTLINIGLRLNLITSKEYEDILLSDQRNIRCPKCSAVTQKEIVNQFGNCLNC